MFSQIDLISHISKFIAKHHKGNCNVRQMNAVISAATSILEAFEREDRDVRSGEGLGSWLCGDRVGLSSKFMAATLSGHDNVEYNYPHDPDDLSRCIGLLVAVPEFAARVPEMAKTGKQWAALVGIWDEIVRLYHEERPSGKAPRCYKAMREALDKC